ncbi:MAG: type II toxin-antitoxin system prevent-host-death family antitoxin [Rhizomicrobium sp.]|jgi:prevent-host-death family protein
MATVTIREAEKQFLELIERAEAGEEIIIARDGKPVVKLTPVDAGKRRPTFGCMKGKLPAIPDAFFFDPLPEEELKLWEGGDEDLSR